MLDKKHYANGQKIYKKVGDKLTYFYKNGKLKAEGPFVNGLMEGEWKFYRETGQLWQVSNFKTGLKAYLEHGLKLNLIADKFPHIKQK